MRRSLRIGTMLTISVAIAGCRLGPDYVRPPIDSPERFRSTTPPAESVANLPWWEVFQDPALQELVHVALEQNRDLRAAYWRVEEARAQLGFERGAHYPAVGVDAGATRADPGDALLGIALDPFSQFQVSGNISWEIDLWGKLRRSTESARAQLLASEWGRRAFVVSLVAETARLYFVLRDLDRRLEVARNTLVSRKASTALIRQRFEGGVVSELDLRQAEIEQEAAAAAVPSFERRVAQTENALSVLLGRNPGAIVRGLPLDRQSLPPDPPAGLPSELLQRRPDVQQAEALLHAQTARIGVAQALRWPSLNLTGALGLRSSELSDLTSSDSVLWSIGGSLTGPLFQFGKNKRRVEVERARTEQAVLAYESSVLGSFREVEDALVGIRTLRDEYAARARQVDAAREAARLSRARYDGGVTNYLEVLDTERSLFQSELDASRTLQERLNALVALYAALGGGWQFDEGHAPGASLNE